MSYHLLVNPGTPQAWKIQLQPGTNRVGRDEANDFTISHESVSSAHCEFTVSEAGIFVKDLGSTNGTFVNGAPVTEIQLQPGQHVQMGQVDMTFEAVGTPVAAPPSAPPALAGGLRISQPHASSSPIASQPATQVQSVIAPPHSTKTRIQPLATDDTGDQKGNFALSLGGVLLGAILGMVIWHLIYRFTGWRFGLMALITGCLAGVAPQLIGHYRSKLMGVLAAVLTLMAIFGAQFLNAKVQFDQFVDETEGEGYAEQVEYSKRAIQAIPNGAEPEIRAFLAKENSDPDQTVKPEEVDAEEIAGLKERLPELREPAAGRISKEQYGKDLRQGSEELQEAGVFKIYLLIRTLGIFNIVNIFLGVGAAFLTAKGK